MITRRSFVTALGASALCAPFASFAQQKLRRIGYLANDPDEKSPTFQAFLRAMAQLRWVRGTNYEIVIKSSHGKDAEFARLAPELVRENVELIVTTGSPSTRQAIAAVKAAGLNTPIIFGSAANPLDQGFVKDLAQPGANVTGIALLVKELAEERWETFKTVLPNARRFGSFYQPDSLKPIRKEIISTDDAAAKGLGLAIKQFAVETIEDVPKALGQARKDRMDAVYVSAASLFVVNRDKVARHALEAEPRLPLLGPDSRFAEAGALASYGEDMISRYTRAATVVDKVLRGTPPGNIAVEGPRDFELVLNMRTAKALGMTFSDRVLSRAKRVIE